MTSQKLQPGKVLYKELKYGISIDLKYYIYLIELDDGELVLCNTLFKPTFNLEVGDICIPILIENTETVENMLNTSPDTLWRLYTTPSTGITFYGIEETGLKIK